MHILINETRPCAYCGKPAVRLYDQNNEPRCTLCQARIVREHVPTFTDKGQQEIDAWEPGMPVHAHV